jgi:hypothetical protein
MRPHIMKTGKSVVGSILTEQGRVLKYIMEHNAFYIVPFTLEVST